MERGDDRGILVPAARDAKFRLERYEPSPDIARFVDWYWIVRWDLRGAEPHTQETLPQPVIHFVLRSGASSVHGVMTSRFRIVLDGKGQGFGVRFKPGAFRAFLGRDVATITDRSLAIDDVFGPLAKPLERDVLAIEETRAQVDLVERFLRPRLPEIDADATFAARVVELAVGDRMLTHAEDLAARAGVSLRALQRLFQRYVGVAPKWVIRRARMTEAAERVAKGDAIAWAYLAAELGYFDQAHFIRDFKAQIGRSPTDYAEACERERDASRS
jgi:AraC-like DNA-binding protein